MSELASQHRGLHYKRKKCLNNPSRRGKIIQLLKSGLSVEKVADQLYLSLSYVRRVRWEAGIVPDMTERLVKREELEKNYSCETLAPSLHGEEKMRYERLKRFHDFCFHNNIIITPSLLRELLDFYRQHD